MGRWLFRPGSLRQRRRGGRCRWSHRTFFRSRRLRRRKPSCPEMEEGSANHAKIRHELNNTDCHETRSGHRRQGAPGHREKIEELRCSCSRRGSRLHSQKKATAPPRWLEKIPISIPSKKTHIWTRGFGEPT